MQRYQDVRPYGQSSNGYIQDTRTLLPKMGNPQREDSYVAVPLMGDQTGQRSIFEHRVNPLTRDTGTVKEQQGQGHNMMDPPASPHPFSSGGMHQQDQIQRVVSPVNQASMAHYQAQYAGYEGYHRNDMDVSQHDPRQQVLRYCSRLIRDAGRLEHTYTVFYAASCSWAVGDVPLP
jgi:hypothetical protein